MGEIQYKPGKWAFSPKTGLIEYLPGQGWIFYESSINHCLFINLRKGDLNRGRGEYLVILTGYDKWKENWIWEVWWKIILQIVPQLYLPLQINWFHLKCIVKYGWSINQFNSSIMFYNVQFWQQVCQQWLRLKNAVSCQFSVAFQLFRQLLNCHRQPGFLQFWAST